MMFFHKQLLRGAQKDSFPHGDKAVLPPTVFKRKKNSLLIIDSVELKELSLGVAGTASVSMETQNPQTDVAFQLASPYCPREPSQNRSHPHPSLGVSNQACGDGQQHLPQRVVR